MALTVQIVENQPHVFVVSLIGSLDSTTYSVLEGEIEHLIAAGQARILTLDLAALEFISSMGIRVIFKAKKDLLRGGGSLFMANIPPLIRKSLEIILDMIEEEEATRRWGNAMEAGAAGPPAPLISPTHGRTLDSGGRIHAARNLQEFAPVEMGALLGQAEQAWLARRPRGTVLVDRLHGSDPGVDPHGRRFLVYFERGSDASMVNVAGVRFCDALVQFLEWLGLADATSVRVRPRVEAAGPFVDIQTEGGVMDEPPSVRGKLLRVFAHRFALAGFNLEIERDHFRLVLGEDDSPPR